jgi:outer membrane receptor protein involved in Fe transport
MDCKFALLAGVSLGLPFSGGAHAQPASTGSSTAAAVAQPSDEIVVTAQKREERLLDVPVPVSVIRAQSLVDSGQTRLQDYYTRVPGLSLAAIGDGNAPSITIRGVTTGGLTSPTVGIVVDDLPYGSSTTQGGGYLAPDIDPSELARVEVLRGPQGTLYGVSSLGGLLKFVTVDPSLSGFSGRIQAGVSTMRHSDDVGYTLRGALNIPVSDTIAVRASGFTSREPGYIDDVRTGQSDVNRRDNFGGRLSLLWRPSSDISIVLRALYQDSDRTGAAEEDTRAGAFRQNFVPESGRYRRTTQAYSATLNATPGAAILTSLTGYSVDRIRTTIDVASVAGGLFVNQAQANFGVAGAVGPLDRQINKFSQEVRLTVPLGDRLQWLVGAFYTNERVTQMGGYQAVNPTTGQVAGTLLNLDTPSRYEEIAGFTDLTFKFSDRFDVQVGGRISHNDQSFSVTRTGPLVPIFFPGAATVPEKRSSDSPFTFLVTPRYRFSEALMLYARAASGYRPGGPNASCGGNVPCQYNSDRTQNFEVGAKGQLFDGALRYDLSLYTIDWKDIQLQLRDPATTLGYSGNGGRARSRGVEFSIEAHPVGGMNISGWVAYNDAQIREVPLTNLALLPGDRLPYSSRWSGNISIDQDFTLGRSLTASVGASASFVGDREGIFRTVRARQTFPSYTQIDLRAALRQDGWSLTAYVNNLTDRRGVLRGGFDNALGPSFYTYIAPRNAGVSIARSF